MAFSRISFVLSWGVVNNHHLVLMFYLRWAQCFAVFFLMPVLPKVCIWLFAPSLFLVSLIVL